MRVLSLPLTLGRADRVDPKYAPLGVLAVAKNLRVRKDGRLASRTGYQPVSMAAVGGTLVAYDLHEYKGRLCALGSCDGDGYPTDLHEYTGEPAGRPWRSTDESGNARVTLTPFTNPREVCGIPSPAGGVTTLDVAAGGGYVCTAYKPADATRCFVQIVRESDDQVVFCQECTSPAYTDVRVVYAVDRFMFLGTLSTNALVLASFIPNASSILATEATVDAASGTAISAFEISTVSNPTTAAVVVAYDRGTASDLSIKVYDEDGTQIGGTIALASTDTDWLDIEADQTNNTINLVIVVAGAVSLYTYNFAGSLLVGPTAMTAGTEAQICRAPAQTGFAEHVAVAVNTSSRSVVVGWRSVAAHVESNSVTVSQAFMGGRLVGASSESQPMAVVFGGFVEPNMTYPSFTNASLPTNALFFVTTGTAHMMTRDLGESSRFLAGGIRLGLARDVSTGRLAWATSLSFALDGVDNATITTVDLCSTKRRQSAMSGGLLHLAGGPPQLYDGHILGEVGFNEVPGIKSVTASNGAGNLTVGATYTYVAYWEARLPDGSVMRSPVSLPSSETMGVSEDTNTIVCTTPHSLRVALGDALYGSDVIIRVFRTIWDATNSVAGSIFRLVAEEPVPSNISSYGATVSVTDLLSDTSASDNEVVYTQSERGALSGPVEHNAPEACSYLSASSARVIAAGLARAHEFQESKESFLGEPISFSRLSSFFGKTSEAIRGAMSLDGIRLLFSRNVIYAVAGQGADDAGGGALPSPVEIPSPGGLKDWRSLLKAPDGVWFQLDDEKLYRMPRGGGSPEWLGVDVQDTLASYPTVTGSALCRKDDTVAFACENTASTDGRIVVRSLRTGLWTEDTPPLQTSQGIEALTGFDDTLAYISGGVVYVQHATSFADVTSTVISTQWKTHPIYPFELGGYGQMHDVLLTGEYRSAGTLALRVSYDDGINFTTYDSFTLTGLTVGQTIQRRWALQQSDTTSAVFEWTFTPSAVGEGFIAHNAAVLVDPAAAGKLKELDPSECA